MIDDAVLEEWFCNEVLPLEAALSRYIARMTAGKLRDDGSDLRQDVYEAALNGARRELPNNTTAYVFTIARNLMINNLKRGRIVSFELVSDLEQLDVDVDVAASERHLLARDELRRAQGGLAGLPPRCREVVRLRKLEGLSTAEAAARMGVGIHTIERQLVLGLRAMANAMLGGDGRVDRGKPALRSLKGGKGS